MLSRLARDLPGFLRAPLPPHEIATTVAGELARREARFLDMAERAIWAHPPSPYRPLLARAGCEPGDLRELVRREGLEGALATLAAAGVHVRLAEFKGRAPVVRGDTRLAVDAADFDNPTLQPHFRARSGGSRGRATSVPTELAFVTELARDTALALQAHDLAAARHVVWLVGGITPSLLYARLGQSPLAWFQPVPFRQRELALGARYLAVLARLAGRRLPVPVLLDLREAGRLARWLAERARGDRPVCVTAYASSAVRVATAAAADGVDLTGVCFVTLGEPFTEAKRRAIAASGAVALVRYALTEAGILGFGCRAPSAADDLHVLDHGYALIRHPVPVGGGAASVDGLLVTALRPTAPKIMLNVESGDHARLERRSCDCRLGAVGLRTHVDGIRSHEKLSGDGMSFVGTGLLHALEVVLPQAFGGVPGDYQVVEEAGAGPPRLRLRVSPGIGALDPAAVRTTFLAELRGRGAVGGTRPTVDRVETVEVVRAWPEATRAGKVLPFHVVREDGGE
jgi:hypothetical protein